MRKRVNILHVLIFANAGLLLIAAGIGWQMTHRYEQLVYNFNAANAQKVLDYAVSDVVWEDYSHDVINLGRNIVQSEALRKMVEQRDRRVGVVLADEFGRGAVSSGRIKLRGLSVYDPDMRPIGESWRTTSNPLPDGVVEEITRREGVDRLKIIARVWRDSDDVRMTVFVPVGGLRLLGYLGIHADPIHALQALDARLGMNVEILSTSGRQLLVPRNYKLADGAAVHEMRLTMRTPQGETLAYVKAKQDVTGLSNQLKSAALFSFAVFILIYGGISAAALTFLGLFLRQVRKREAFADAEIEAQRKERLEAAEARLRADKEAAAVRRSELLQIANRFESNVKSVVQFVADASVKSTSNAETLAKTAQRTAELAGAAAGASDQAFESVNTVANRSEELSASAAEITRQVARSSSIANKAVTEANETNDVMRGLETSAEKIGEVVNLINAIAGQTNLLALNATIEAARAGEAGKGFAVVASEVKALATQTAKATDEISAQIGAIQASTRNAVEAIERVSRTITEISGIASRVATAVEQQGVATQDITQNVTHAAVGARAAATNITGVREAAGETGHVADEVLKASRELARHADSLHHEVDRFLVTVRAG